MSYNDVFGILIKSPCISTSDESGAADIACRLIRGSCTDITRVFSTPGLYALLKLSSRSAERRLSIMALVRGGT